MHSCWTVLYIAAWTQMSIGSRCPLSIQNPHLYQRCSVGDQGIPCGGFLQPGAVVHFQCAEYYQLNVDSNVIECLSNGQWSSPTPTCVPECGKLSSAVPLIVHGHVLPAGAFPWQVALYHRSTENWEFWCGGSLISPRMVLTAAHCAWRVPAADLKVALGKEFREMKVEEGNAQMIQVKEVDMLSSYQDVSGNYNGDLALLFLNTEAVFGPTVSPVCIDWDLKYIDQQLKEGNTGVSLGWGLTENDTFSTELRGLRLPVMSDEHCIQQQQRDFKKYITYTSFCAGYTNGTGVCNGDSGGGLAFLDPNSDTWYLQGVVSVSPRRRGTLYCDPTFFTVFTKVGMFTKWLREMAIKEKAMEIN